MLSLPLIDSHSSWMTGHVIAAIIAGSLGVKEHSNILRDGYSDKNGIHCMRYLGWLLYTPSYWILCEHKCLHTSQARPIPSSQRTKRRRIYETNLSVIGNGKFHKY